MVPGYNLKTDPRRFNFAFPNAKHIWEGKADCIVMLCQVRLKVQSH